MHDPGTNNVSVHFSELWVGDVEMEAIFYNPYSLTVACWDYGFILQVGNTSDFRFIVVSVGTWSINTWSETEGHRRLQHGEFQGVFNTNTGASNHLRVAVEGERGEFYVNGERIATINSKSLPREGYAAVATRLHGSCTVGGAVTRF